MDRHAAPSGADLEQTIAGPDSGQVGHRPVFAGLCLGERVAGLEDRAGVGHGLVEEQREQLVGEVVVAAGCCSNARSTVLRSLEAGGARTGAAAAGAAGGTRSFEDAANSRRTAARSPAAVQSPAMYASPNPILPSAPSRRQNASRSITSPARPGQPGPSRARCTVSGLQREPPTARANSPRATVGPQRRAGRGRHRRTAADDGARRSSGQPPPPTDARRAANHRGPASQSPIPCRRISAVTRAVISGWRTSIRSRVRSVKREAAAGQRGRKAGAVALHQIHAHHQPFARQAEIMR